MKIEKQSNSKEDLEALYIRAMHDFDIYTFRLNYVDKELKMAREEIRVLSLAGTKFIGMDRYVENCLMKQFYDVKDSMHMMRKSIKSNNEKLQAYFTLNHDKEVLFNHKAKDVASVMVEKEKMVDDEIDKCSAYLKLYEATITA